MPRDWVEEYLTTVRALRNRYAGEMEIFLGLELDFYGERPQGLDYVIGSVHGLMQEGRFYAVDESPEVTRRAVEEGFGGDWYRYTDAYFDLVPSCPRGPAATGSATLT